MTSNLSLKFGAIAFAMLWTGGMVWSSGAIDRTDVAVLSVCGVLAGIGSYYAMRWTFQLARLLRRP